MTLDRDTVKKTFARVERACGQGKFEEGARELTSLISRAEAAGAAEDVGDLLIMLGQIQCRFEAGIPRANITFARAIALAEKALGPDDEEDLYPMLTDAYMALRSCGRHEEAAPYIERAAALYEKVNSEEDEDGSDDDDSDDDNEDGSPASADPDHVVVLDHLASAHLIVGKTDAATRTLLRALDLAKKLPPTPENTKLLAAIATKLSSLPKA